MSGQPLLVAAAVVVDGERVLVTRRPPKGHLANFWEFPGGKLEAGESPEAALVRECREELGVDVEVHDILDVTFHRYETRDVLLLFYFARIVAGEIAHLGVSEHRWVRTSELASLELPPADDNVVRKLVAGRRA